MDSFREPGPWTKGLFCGTSIQHRRQFQCSQNGCGLEPSHQIPPQLCAARTIASASQRRCEPSRTDPRAEGSSAAKRSCQLLSFWRVAFRKGTGPLAVEPSSQYTGTPGRRDSGVFLARPWCLFGTASPEDFPEPSFGLGRVSGC